MAPPFIHSTIIHFIMKGIFCFALFYSSSFSVCNHLLIYMIYMYIEYYNARPCTHCITDSALFKC